MSFFRDCTSSDRQRVGNKSPDHADKQLQAPCVHQEQKHLPTEHPAPAFENVGGGLGAPHRKGYRGSVDQHAQQNIPLRCFKEQFQIIPGQNQRQDQDDEGHRSIGADSDYDHQNGAEAGEIQ